MIVDQLLQSRRQTNERQFMPRQYQMIRAGDFFKTLAALEPIAHRICIWLCGIHPQIRADRRNNLISCQNQTVILAPEGGMLGCMTMADMNTPMAAPLPVSLPHLEAAETPKASDAPYRKS